MNEHVQTCHIEAPWSDLLRAQRLDSLVTWRTDPRVHIWRDIAERQNGVIDLPGDLRLHVKRLRPPEGMQVEAEVRGLELLRQAGIATVPLVAWGVDSSGGGVLVTEDLAGFRPADQRMLAGEPFSRFADATADVAGRLHTKGLHHRDLYLCHFLFDDSGAVRLIDAARVRPLPWLTRRRWITKDLAQFRFSALAAGATEAEADAWLERWAGATNTASRRWRGAVLRKTAAIARHDAKLAHTHPERYASLRS